MTRPQEQFAELTRRTQENFKHLWEQWNQRSTDLLKGVGHRPTSTTTAPSNPEEVLDAVFDFAENLITQQRAFAKQMLRATSQGQQALSDVAGTTAGSPLSTESSIPDVPAATPESSVPLPDANKGR